MVLHIMIQPVAGRTGVASPGAAWICRVLTWWWWIARAHIWDAHGLPRDKALEPPPARWVEGWPRGHM